MLSPRPTEVKLHVLRTQYPTGAGVEGGEAFKSAYVLELTLYQ